MERSIVFLDWKNQYCENDHTTQGSLQIQCNSNRITNGIFQRTKTKHCKISMETQKYTLSSKSYLKKNRTWRIILFDLKWYCRGTVIKTVWYGSTDRHIDQWNGIKSPEISPCTNGQLTYDKGGKTIHWRKDSFFSKWCFWGNWTATWRRKKLEHSLIW